mgnify:CR=1 FL=1
MSFVWQYYRFDSSFCDAYASLNTSKYNLNESYFNFYTMEQQAAIIADYWLLNKYDLQEYEWLTDCCGCSNNALKIKMNLLAEYHNVLMMFVNYIR